MIIDQPINIDAALEEFRAPESGAVVTFSGVVRDQNKGRRVESIFYDCYREMAKKELARIADEVKSALPVDKVYVQHRIGEVPVGEASLLVVVSAAHRKAAYDASQAIVDEIKRRAPIWKKEHYADKTTQWI